MLKTIFLVCKNLVYKIYTGAGSGFGAGSGQKIIDGGSATRTDDECAWWHGDAAQVAERGNHEHAHQISCCARSSLDKHKRGKKMPSLVLEKRPSIEHAHQISCCAQFLRQTQEGEEDAIFSVRKEAIY
jgi:hypothetical protein